MATEKFETCVVEHCIVSTHTGAMNSSSVIAVGASVTLQKNLNVDWGLVNSARGAIKRVHYKDDVVYCIVVDFPKYTGNMQEMETFGGVPIFKTFTNTYCRDTNRFIWVNKFPIGLYYGSTIHKIQGQTLPSVAVYLGSSQMFPGMDYIALSRTRKIENLMILDENISQNRFCNQNLGEKIEEERD
ncbi:unnamed protein product [Allacma fusca]|uniref:ATP-dependent DNA helicase PIF1 n=1 Tax=Allacma fusca TaxID=39272 RepID=A0A8J2KLF1_9HEXA|nr:unnamed protein product [Allacma fusca]